MRIPTINQMVKVYVDSARVERLKCGRPSEGTVRNTLVGVRRFMGWAEGIGKGDCAGRADASADEADGVRADVVTAKVIRKYLAHLLTTNIKPVSAMSFVYQLQQLYARWARPYYEDHGWKVQPFPQLPRRAKSARYIRPSAEQLAKVKAWYENLPVDMLWFVATMMLEFGMRNGDIRRLERGNFVEAEGRVFLNYTPHKTEHSSGRVVKWPIHPTIWASMEILKPWTRRVTWTHFEKLNAAMRELGFTGTKGAYELRKICIDHVYQKYGAELATSISGDDIKTITRYYADPAQPNLGSLRILDLI